jgi:hypothetical protein
MDPQTFLKVTLHVDNDAWCVLDHHDEDFDRVRTLQNSPHETFRFTGTHYLDS